MKSLFIQVYFSAPISLFSPPRIPLLYIWELLFSHVSVTLCSFNFSAFLFHVLHFGYSLLPYLQVFWYFSYTVSSLLQSTTSDYLILDILFLVEFPLTVSSFHFSAVIVLSVPLCPSFLLSLFANYNFSVISGSVLMTFWNKISMIMNHILFLLCISSN